MLGLFDTHIQADGLLETDLRSMAAFGIRAALLPAHDGIGTSTAEDLLAHFEDLTSVQPGRLVRAGVRPFVALGVAPSRVPERDVERVLDLLPHFCGQARVVALGQIGPGETPWAQEVFSRQLELASSLDLPVLVELPANAGDRAVRRTLSLLAESGLPPERAMLGRAPLEGLATILGRGHWARLSLRTGRAPVLAAVELVRKLGASRLALGSDAGDGAADILAVPKAAAEMEKAGLPPAVIRKVAWENALGFLGIDRACLEEAPARAAGMGWRK